MKAKKKLKNMKNWIKISNLIRSITENSDRCIVSLIRKNVAINLMKNVDLTEESGTL